MSIANTTITVIVLSVLSSCIPEEAASPPNMVRIPEGTFIMGGKSMEASPDEFPRHEVTVSAFYMDETEVTNQQFMAFVDATGYVTTAEKPIDWAELSTQLPPGTPKPADSLLKAGSLVFRPTEGPVDLRDYSQWWEWKVGANWRQPEGPGSSLENRMDHPVVHISWEDAQAYAKWTGKRLPTEAEWEWAALGGEDIKYPWGNDPIEEAHDKANFWQGFFPYQNEERDGYYGTSPVRSFPPNGYGLYDMAGNVWEWCSDTYRYDNYQIDHSKGSVTNPQGPSSSQNLNDPYATNEHVIRGGSYLCNDSYCSGYRVSRRMPSDGDSGTNHKGFRCVKDL
jgi:formylglycine-generating enzyme required for sulfatase activity